MSPLDEGGGRSWIMIYYHRKVVLRYFLFFFWFSLVLLLSWYFFGFKGTKRPRSTLLIVEASKTKCIKRGFLWNLHGTTNNYQLFSNKKATRPAQQGPARLGSRTAGMESSPLVNTPWRSALWLKSLKGSTLWWVGLLFLFFFLVCELFVIFYPFWPYQRAF